MPHPRRILLLAPAALLLGGCLFEPRDAEPPGTGSGIEYLVQRDAANVWANIQTAINAQDVAGWEGALSPDFVAIDETQGNDAWWEANWNRQREIDFATTFFTSVASIEADMRYQDIQVDLPSGEGDWVIVYRVTVSEAAGGETSYVARARITFKLEDNFWYITRWTDEQAEVFEGSLRQTLGVLRYALASQ